MFQKILNDPYIIDIYSKISKFEDQNKGWAHHDLSHVQNVTNMMEKIFTDLNYDSHFIEEAKVAGILHDLGAIEGKDNHAYRGYLMAKDYIDTHQIELKNKDLVLEAIKMHSDHFNTDNMILCILIFCDKLDIKKSRVAKEGYNITGMRQLQYIDDIETSITDKDIIVNFKIENGYDQKELEEFYFTEKVFNAIKALANKLNRNYKISINNKDWNAY